MVQPILIYRRFADELHDAVSTRLESSAYQLEPHEVLFAGGDVRALYCFRSIRVLSNEGLGEDIEILTRSLLSIALRSLYVVASDNPDEQRRRWRALAIRFHEDEAKRLGYLKETPMARPDRLRGIEESLA